MLLLFTLAGTIYHVCIRSPLRVLWCISIHGVREKIKEKEPAEKWMLNALAWCLATRSPNTFDISVSFLTSNRTISTFLIGNTRPVDSSLRKTSLTPLPPQTRRVWWPDMPSDVHYIVGRKSPTSSFLSWTLRALTRRIQQQQGPCPSYRGTTLIYTHSPHRDVHD